MGKVVVSKIKGKKFERTNIVAAQISKKIIAPLKYKKHFRKMIFLYVTLKIIQPAY